MTTTEFALRMAIALALGTLIGAEREWHHKLAGLKTNALVCVGAALFSALGYAYPNSDPSRIAAQIASGIGFLGAGAILRDGMNIRGLTTAATVWCAAGIGAMCGSGWMLNAAIGTIFIVMCNVVLKECAGLFFKTGGVESLNDQNITLVFSTEKSEALELRKQITDFLKAHHLLIKGIAIDPVNGHMSWSVNVMASSATTHVDAESLCEEFSLRFKTPAGWRIS
jgi:putative Mg2+ transporter-C (MgtC) family protein